ncbi:MAG TPA: hypothetical protein VI136_05560 [Verrucomicrobiae bacterium]
MNRTSTMRLLTRSCLEASPLHVQPKPFAWKAASGSGGRALAQLHQLKRKLLREALEAAPETRFFKRLCGAANQAADLAWATSHPLLVFPCLFDEEVRRLHQDFEERQFTESGPWAAPAPVDVRPESEEASRVSGLFRPIMAGNPA